MEMTRRVAKDQANGLLILPIGSDKDYNLSEIQPIVCNTLIKIRKILES
jgi:hypothetical protein